MDQALAQEQPKGNGTLLPDDVSRETSEEGVADKQLAAQEEASKHGWRDKDEYVAKGGREQDWVPADQFLEFRKQISTTKAKENKRLERALESRDRALNDALKRIEVMEKAQAEREQARGEVQESVLWDQRRQALENQDWNEVNRLDREMRKLERSNGVAAPRQPPPLVQDPRVTTLLEEFADDHPEYRRPEMQALLVRAAKLVKDEISGLSDRALLDEAHDTARRIWSDRYTTTTKRNAPAMAETSGTPARASSGEKTWSDLKSDARQALDDFIKKSETHAKMPLNEARARILKNVPADHFKG